MAFGGINARDNVNPSLLAVLGTTPANPAGGLERVYADSADGLLKRVDSSGTVVAIEFSDTKIVQLATITLGAAVASVAFTGIPAGHIHLRLVAQLLVAGTAPVNAASLAIQINADTGTDYDTQFFYVNATTTVAAASDTAEVQGRAGSVDINAAAPATGATPLVLDIPNYAGTAFRKQWLSTTYTTASPGNYLFVVGGEWRSTAAITRLDVLHMFGLLQPGSVLTLYGLD